MKFLYRAYIESGRMESGLIEAGDEADAARRLSLSGKRAFDIRAASQHKDTPRLHPIRRLLAHRGKISQSRLFLDLATLTEAGMTLSQALRAMLAGETVPTQKQAIETVSAAMNAGHPAAAAFARVDAVSPETIALIAGGERTARLPVVFRALASQMVAREQRRTQLRNALAYPAFLLVMMCAALAVVTFVLTPALSPIFDNAGQTPPMLLRVFGAARETVLDPRMQLAFLSIAVAALLLLFGPMRGTFGRVAQKSLVVLPLLGGAMRKSSSARYLASLSLLLGGGTPMTEALALAARGSLELHRARLTSVRDDVAAGQRLPKALEKTGLFDPRTISLIAVGDEVNRLPAVLDRASAILDQEATALLSNLLAAVTPATTIILGTVIGGLVVSVMTALLGINDLALQ